MVPNRVIGAALWSGLARAANVEVIAPARVLRTEPGESSRVVFVDDSQGGSRALEARLVVAADGAHSVIRDQAGERNPAGASGIDQREG